MTKGIFISTENTADERVVRVIDLLKAAGHTVTTSPINPANGSDLRWKDWYEQGCQTAIESNNVFLAIVTPGYDCSTWMAIEFETAWKANQASGRPRLYVLGAERPLPAGFRQYEQAATLLPFDVNEAVAFLLERFKPGLEGSAEDEARELCTVGGLVDETSVCLAVYGEDLDPERVTELLGRPPTSSHRRGDRGPKSPLYKRGGWFLELRGAAPEGPEELVSKVLRQVPDDEAVWRKLGQLYEVQLRFAFHMTGSNRGFDFPADLVGKVAHLHASLVFDIYAYGEEERSS